MIPSSVCTNHVARQQGQAIVEALLMLPLMAALLWGVTWVGGLQFLAQQLAHASRKAAMAGALGQHATPLHSFAAARQTRQMRDLDGVATPSLSRLQREWFGEGLRLMAVYAQSAHSSSGALRSPSITRHTHVAVGSGHALSDHDARHRIAKPSDAWRGVAPNRCHWLRRIGWRRSCSAWTVLGAGLHYGLIGCRDGLTSCLKDD